MKTRVDVCHCCTGPLKRISDLWCDRCARHVLKTGKIEDRTYTKQFGLPCPYTPFRIHDYRPDPTTQ